MSKKYQVTYIYDEEIEGHEACYELKHYEYDEELEECVDIEGRYIASATWEASELMDNHEDEFVFDHYPTIQEVEEVLLERLKMAALCFEDYVIKYGTIHDTDTCEKISKYNPDNEEILERLSYTGKFEVYPGAISDIEVEEIEE